MDRKASGTFFLGPYGLLWRAARPVLRRHKRLRDGFADRLAPESWSPPWDGPTDVWVQAASGGEAYLARQLLEALRALNPQQPLRILCTSCTRQGLDVLEAAKQHADKEFAGLDLAVRVFPLDEPAVMRRAVSMARPRIVTLLETELWPGLMAACVDAGIPMAVVNGRMTEKSWNGYRLLRNFWRRSAPARILAMDDADASRFADLFGHDRVGLMRNMKFDAVSVAGTPAPASTPALAGRKGESPAVKLLSGAVPVVLLASVREEEEPLLAPVLAFLRANVPDAVIVVAPRHMERVPAWAGRLGALFGPSAFRLRSELEKENRVAEPGDAVLWDAFGELTGLYGRADAVFVGGSLAPLGGQNFLEAAGQGQVPVIGPYWKNFTWVGEEFFAAGLGVRVPNAGALGETLVRLLRRHPDPASVRARLEAYIATRRGGTRAAAEAVLSLGLAQRVG